MRILGGLICALAACCSSAQAGTFHTDTFAADTQSWSGSFQVPPVWEPSGGPAGAGDGYLRVDDSGNLATHNVTPAWTGDLATLGAARIIVDLMSPSTSEPLEIRIVLFSTDSVRWTSTIAQPISADGVWRNFTFSLAQDAIMKVQGVNENTYAGLMGSVTRVMLRHDPVGSAGGTGVNGTLNLDNIELAAPPPVEIPGDFNGDGAVDGADLDDAVDGWKTRFGVDLDGNDFLVWQTQLGAPFGEGASTTVPEPRGLFMILAAAALGSWRQRK